MNIFQLSILLLLKVSLWQGCRAQATISFLSTETTTITMTEIASTDPDCTGTSTTISTQPNSTVTQTVTITSTYIVTESEIEFFDEITTFTSFYSPTSSLETAALTSSEDSTNSTTGSGAFDLPRVTLFTTITAILCESYEFITESPAFFSNSSTSTTAPLYLIATTVTQKETVTKLDIETSTVRTRSKLPAAGIPAPQRQTNPIDPRPTQPVVPAVGPSEESIVQPATAPATPGANTQVVTTSNGGTSAGRLATLPTPIQGGIIASLMGIASLPPGSGPTGIVVLGSTLTEEGTVVVSGTTYSLSLSATVPTIIGTNASPTILEANEGSSRKGYLVSFRLAALVLGVMGFM